MSIKIIALTSLLFTSTLLTNITATNQTYSATLYTMTNQAYVSLDINSYPYMWMYDASNSSFQIQYDMGGTPTSRVRVLLVRCNR
jgi:hypothetical protein